MRARLRSLATCHRGATAVEYGLILALIVLAMLVALVGVARETTSLWNNVNNKVTTAQ